MLFEPTFETVKIRFVRLRKMPDESEKMGRI